jgi:hypothetical protein
MRQCCSLFFFWPTTLIMHINSSLRCLCLYCCIKNQERRIKTNSKNLDPKDDFEQEAEAVAEEEAEVTQEWKTFNYQFPALYNRVSSECIIGVAPITRDMVNNLYTKENVRGVVNLCREWQGANNYYKKIGITQLILPTTDFSLPNEESCRKAAEFISTYAQRGESVYIHCKAGRGRSVAVVVAYLVLYRGMTSRKATNHIINIRAVAVDNAESLKYLEIPLDSHVARVTTTKPIEEEAGREK